MIDVVMPQMGESIVEGTLTRWLKKPGERVERDEPLFEISTDKVDTEIPAPASGVLQDVLIEEGKTVGINTVVGRIADEGGAAAAPQAPAEQAAPTPAPAAQPDGAPSTPEQPRPSDPVAPSQGGNAVAPPPPQPAAAQPPAQAAEAPEDQQQGPLSPVVRKIARENNIDLKQVRGTGAGGRITKADVEAYVQGGSQAAPPAPPPAAQQSVQQAAAPAPAPAPMPRGEQARTRIEPMSNMRSKIAEHMIMSQRTSAHVTTVHKVDVTKVAKIRAKEKEQFQAQYGFGLTFLPFFARAAAVALRAFPIVNGSIEGSNIVYHNEINIGIAVALDGGSGLIVPVIRNADEKNVVGLQRSIVDLAARARSRQLKADYGIVGDLFEVVPALTEAIKKARA